MKNIHTTEPSLKANVEKGKPLFGWTWHPANSKKLSNGKMHGTAFQCQVQARFGRGAPAIFLYLNNYRTSDGKVYIPMGVPNIGVGITEGIAMVVAEELGAKYEDIIAFNGAYEPLAPTSPAPGSMFPDTAFAAKEAALNLKDQLCKAAAKKFGVNPEDMDTADSTIFVKADPTKKVAFKDIGSFAAFSQDFPANYGTQYISDDFIYPSTAIPGAIYNMNTMYCEVEVATETGQIDVKKLLGVTDPGKCIRPSSYNNQAEGLLDWTIGANMFEDFVWDKDTGVLLTGNSLDYKIPSLLDCDMKEHAYVETRNGGGAYGSVGIAEFFHSYIIIVLAVHNVIGKWVSPPLTPDKVLKALGKA
jgi:carbon-monoxide dehydrogenase large subunit